MKLADIKIRFINNLFRLIAQPQHLRIKSKQLSIAIIWWGNRFWLVYKLLTEIRTWTVLSGCRSSLAGRSSTGGRGCSSAEYASWGRFPGACSSDRGTGHRRGCSWGTSGLCPRLQTARKGSCRRASCRGQCPATRRWPCLRNTVSVGPFPASNTRASLQFKTCIS